MRSHLTLVPYIVLPILAIAGGGVLSRRMEANTRYVDIKLPDAAFRVKWDWMSPAYRVGGFPRPYEIEIPCKEVPAHCKRHSLSRGLLCGDVYVLRFDSEATPKAGEAFSRLKSQEGWRLLPDETGGEFRVTERPGTPGAFSKSGQRVYELKSDPRYTVNCTTLMIRPGFPAESASCRMSVPYRQFVDPVSTQFAITFNESELRYWRQLAEATRAVLRQFESKGT